MLIEFLNSLLAGVTGAILATYLNAYVSQKGKNKADKEDITEITDLIEKSKLIHQELLERIKIENSLRASIIEKRLIAHQEAYDFSRRINSLYNIPELKKDFLNLMQEVWDWWGKNCLFLDQKPRRAFLDAWIKAKDFDYTITDKNLEQITEYRRIIYGACRSIEESVGLPPINLEEIERIQPKLDQH